MNKEATSLFLSPSPGSFYFKSTPPWLIFKMLFSSRIFLLKNHSGSPGNVVSNQPPALNPFHPLLWHVTSIPVREVSWPLLFLAPCLFPSCIPSWNTLSPLPSNNFAYPSMLSSQVWLTSVCQSTLLPLCGELLLHHTMTLNYSMVAWRSLGHVQIPAL